ncbi:hypothetical protein MPNT_40087 [Candidatus Methylacidithermus pantelleriae]|uniref:Uncharacterized protein n=1 Tax=Candidatus Methylacidithermus pantelleriae TaxID=2744239 RepID=A0A8J2BKU0_9BACT|nr:hypothetical protein MPNT_40087 [Candidatus Methylacidithermus pantelleriae]
MTIFPPLVSAQSGWLNTAGKRVALLREKSLLTYNYKYLRF